AEGGAPVEQVSVRLQSAKAAVATVVTDAAGLFDFAGLSPGSHELYVSVVNFQLATRRVDVIAGGTTDVTIALTRGAGTYTETVSVVGTADSRNSGTPVETRIDAVALQQLSGLLANDPLRAVQALPGVTSSDDFRSEFAVRGAGPAQTGFIFEGISTPFLLHTVQQVHDSGSIAMVSSEVLDSVSLRSGSYPQRFGDRTGAELEFQMREGSRDRVRARLSITAVDASAVAEGPLGHDQRGSWLLSGRKSYLDLVLSRMYPDQTVNFGFGDLQMKLTHDLGANQRLELSGTAGRSRLGLGPNEVTNPTDLRDAFNESALGVLAWRFTPSASLSVVQRLGVVANSYRNTSRDGPVLDEGATRDLVYRTDWSMSRASPLMIDFGTEARWTDAASSQQRLSAGRLVARERFDAQSTRVSAFVSGRTRVGRATVAPGVRVDHWALIDSTAASPWLQATVPMGKSLILSAGGGVYRQSPDSGSVRGLRGTLSLGLSNATHTDISMEGRVHTSVRWRVTAYDREDRGLLRLPGSEPRVANNVFVNGSTTTRWTNALDGHARGIEWLLERHVERGLSGWVSYAFGHTRYDDRVTRERFWGDYDQRHTLNAFGTLRVSDRTSVSAQFRAGSNTPAVGYFTERGGQNFLADERNTLRIPQYSRLDIRANRVFPRRRGRLTLHVELLNALARDNLRVLPPSINRRTFEATGLFESVLPFVPSAGLLIEF
ncbi:MAG: carboxypeptidase-like regulatory domain-containing protein, partial [Vicinamibacterales bacterium]